MFELQPTLSDGLLALRPMRADDHDALYAVASDPLIWALHPFRNRHEAPVFRRFFDEGMASAGMLAVVDQANGAIIGSSRYNGFACHASEIEIGWTFLSRSCWGGHYNRSLKRMMLRHAFRFVETVLFHVGEQNHRSRVALLKIGAVLSDHTDEVKIDGVIFPHVFFTLSKRDFEASPLNLEIGPRA